jgi:hypothetical protein
MHFQYAFAAMLIMGGIATVVVGPDVGGEKPDGTPGPVPEHQRIWMRLFGVGCILCGVFLLIATLLGFRARLGEPALV